MAASDIALFYAGSSSSPEEASIVSAAQTNWPVSTIAPNVDVKGHIVTVTDNGYYTPTVASCIKLKKIKHIVPGTTYTFYVSVSAKAVTINISADSVGTSITVDFNTVPYGDMFIPFGMANPSGSGIYSKWAVFTISDLTPLAGYASCSLSVTHASDDDNSGFVLQCEGGALVAPSGIARITQVGASAPYGSKNFFCGWPPESGMSVAGAFGVPAAPDIVASKNAWSGFVELAWQSGTSDYTLTFKNSYAGYAIPGFTGTSSVSITGITTSGYYFLRPTSASWVCVYLDLVACQRHAIKSVASRSYPVLLQPSSRVLVPSWNWMFDYGYAYGASPITGQDGALFLKLYAKNIGTSTLVTPPVLVSMSSVTYPPKILSAYDGLTVGDGISTGVLRDLGPVSGTTTYNSKVITALPTMAPGELAAFILMLAKYTVSSPTSTVFTLDIRS